jgi:hypothetical protein
MLPEYVDLCRAQKILGELWTVDDVITLIIDGRLPAYAAWHSFENGRCFNKKKKRYEVDSTFHRDQFVAIKTIVGLDVKLGHSTQYFIEYESPDEAGKIDQEYIESKNLLIKTSDLESLKVHQAETIARSASNTLKNLQTADIDKKIDDVIEVINAAIRLHLRGNRVERVVNHILFLREAELDSKKRAKDKVKEYIERNYSDFGFSVISHRPGKNDGHFVNTLK